MVEERHGRSVAIGRWLLVVVAGRTFLLSPRSQRAALQVSRASAAHVVVGWSRRPPLALAVVRSSFDPGASAGCSQLPPRRAERAMGRRPQALTRWREPSGRPRGHGDAGSARATRRALRTTPTQTSASLECTSTSLMEATGTSEFPFTANRTVIPQSPVGVRHTVSTIVCYHKP